MYVRLVFLGMNMLKDLSAYKVNRMDSNQEIISRLKFIGRIKKGEKINTRHMYVQPDGLGTSFSRTFVYQDNRGNALNFVQETISRSFELLVTYERNDGKSNDTLYNNLTKDLMNAIVGLTNLKFTYINDVKFCCDMDTLLENVKARIANFKVVKDEIEE